MNIWLEPLMQSERSDEEAVSRRRAASCISVQGLAGCQPKESFYCTHSTPLTTLQCSFTLLSSSRLLSVLHFLAPSSSFSFWLSVFPPLCLQIPLYCWFASSLFTLKLKQSQHKSQGAFERFPNRWREFKFLGWKGCEICIVGCVHMARQVLMFMYMNACASQLIKDIGGLSHMYDYWFFTHAV